MGILAGDLSEGEYKVDYRKRLKRTAIVVLFPVISYLILGPLEIYSGNKKDFSFVFTDFIWMFLGIAILFWALVSVVAALFNDNINEKICTAILIFGVASYIQNMFLNIKLSEADGSPMNWESIKSYVYINLGIWIILIGLIVILHMVLNRKWTGILTGSAAFFSAVQLAAVFFILVSELTADVEGEGIKDLNITGKGQFEVAKNHNIIVIVLDTFGNTQMENTWEINPDLLDEFSDFTYYNNADCHYYCTFPSMTHMLTGNEFDFTVNGKEWLNRSWQSEKATKFYDILSDKGYMCNLFSNNGGGIIYGDLENLYEKFSNVQPEESVIDHSGLLYLLGKMSIYKYCPYIVKPHFEVLTSEFDGIATLKENKNVIDDNTEFYEALVESELKVNPECQNALIIQHLSGTHAPYTTDRNAKFVEETTIDETVQGLITICKEYLQQLKKLDVYDEATIIITADHGSWSGGDPQPILFVKQSGEKHRQLEVNTAPVSLDDFQATILSLIGEDNYEYGKSFFDWSEGEIRDRTVYMRQKVDEYPEVPGLTYNVYFEYNYTKDKKELVQKVNEGPDNIIQSMPW